jgi:energy-converting hydrogenase B subunit F
VDEETLKEYQGKEVPKLAVFSLFVLTALCIIIGLDPSLITNYLWDYAREIGVNYRLK